MDVNLRRVDLNLLPILQALLREGSITRAAAALNLSQPATSQALGRLRHLFKDPLLVQVGRTMKRTPRADELRVLVDQSCASMAALLSEGPFNPSAAIRTFSIAMPDYVALFVGQELLPVLRNSAPGLTVRLVDASPTVREQLLAGSLDMAVLARVPFLDGLSLQGGFFEEIVCVAGLDHPLARRSRISNEELSRHRCLDLDLTPYHLSDFGPSHASEQVKFAPSHLLALPLLVATSGTVAIVTRALARLAMRYAPLKLIELLEPGRALELCIAWSPVNDADVAHRWLRNQLARALSESLCQTPKGASRAGR